MRGKCHSSDMDTVGNTGRLYCERQHASNMFSNIVVAERLVHVSGRPLCNDNGYDTLREVRPTTVRGLALQA